MQQFRRRMRTAVTSVTTTVVLAVLLSGCGATAHGGTDHGTPGGHGFRSTPCSDGDLTVALDGRDGAPLPAPATGDDPSAIAIVLTDRTGRSCVLRGWPEARYAVGGVPFGQEALRIRAVPQPSVTLRPGQSAQAYLTIRSNDTIGGCEPTTPDAIEVVAPGTTRRLSAALPTPYASAACLTDHDTLLSVQAVVPL